VFLVMRERWPAGSVGLLVRAVEVVAGVELLGIFEDLEWWLEQCCIRDGDILWTTLAGVITLLTLPPPL